MAESLSRRRNDVVPFVVMRDALAIDSPVDISTGECIQRHHGTADRDSSSDRDDGDGSPLTNISTGARKISLSRSLITRRHLVVLIPRWFDDSDPPRIPRCPRQSFPTLSTPSTGLIVVLQTHIGENIESPSFSAGC